MRFQRYILFIWLSILIVCYKCISPKETNNSPNSEKPDQICDTSNSFCFSLNVNNWVKNKDVVDKYKFGLRFSDLALNENDIFHVVQVSKLNMPEMNALLEGDYWETLSNHKAFVPRSF